MSIGQRHWCALILCAWELLCPEIRARAGELDPVWNESLSALNERNYDVAIAHIQDWISTAEKQGIRSPEAFHNLATIYYQQKKYAACVASFLRGLSATGNPFSVWPYLSTLSAIQKEIGVKDSVFQNSFIQIALLTTPDFLSLIISAGLWFFALFLFFRWKRKSADWMIAGIACFLLFASALGYSNRIYFGSLGVLNAQDADVPLFQFDASGKPIELLTLPPGTVVSIGEQNDTYVRITQPIPGWIASNSITVMGESDPSLKQKELGMSPAFQKMPTVASRFVCRRHCE